LDATDRCRSRLFYNRHRFGKVSGSNLRYGPTVYSVVRKPVTDLVKIWEPRRLTTLWASTACYRDSFTFIEILSPLWRRVRIPPL
jgi:hypothetical protein